MKRSALLLAVLCVGLVQAQNTYRWVDHEGKVHYGDRPPPPKAAREVQEKRFAAPTADKELPYALRQAVENFPVTLYISTECGAPCKDGREYLARRAIPFNEKSVTTQQEIDALKQLLGGAEAAAPVLQVGAKTYKGWLQDEWQRLLDAAGYPKTAGPATAH